MNTIQDLSRQFVSNPYVKDMFEYWVDACQRSILFTDTMRKRGNNYLKHLREGQPPVLTFDYEVVLDGRDLERPVNYALVRIIDRRVKKDEHKSVEVKEKRASGKAAHKDEEGKEKRPIVVIDPRAGHGPGIGGSKRDSEIGIALAEGHPVYFIFFIRIHSPARPLQMLKERKSASLRR
jgi:hypothetical protein